MKITKGNVVTIEYVMRDPFGKILESSEQLGNLSYLQGFGNMLPGVEKKLEGEMVGYECDIVVQPEDGYGQMDDSLIERFERANFDFIDEPEVGMEIVLETPDGEEMPAVVEHVDDQSIVLNANHPLAGIVLHFKVKVVDIRPATQEELDAGQPLDDGHMH